MQSADEEGNTKNNMKTSNKHSKLLYARVTDVECLSWH